MFNFPRLIVSTTLVVSSVALAAPVELTDRQLDRIAAGSTDYDPVSAVQSSGGAIVGNSSTANLTTTGDVTLKDAVQQGARAVNLVNSAESGVANGVNVWDGRVDTQMTATKLDVGQANAIVQDQSRMANIAKYIRPEANVSRTVTETSETTHTGKVDTAQEILGQKLQGGMGVSIAGQLDADLKGGSINLSNQISASFSGTVKGTGGLFGNIETSGTTTVEATTVQSLVWVLPDVVLSLKGAGCYVEIGSCDSSGTYKSSSSETITTHSPFALENARAEYIVVDNSKLDATTTYTVALSGNAQQNSQAVNLVNAAGSVVANAVNVSRTPTVGPHLNLNQVNTIVQRR
jgi:ubiquinone biosynthesis protein UbiJ